MPIISTQGQQAQPPQAQDPIVSPPPRLQSAFTPTPVQQVPPQQSSPLPPKPVVAPQSEDYTLDDTDDDEDFGAAPSTAASVQPKQGTSLSRMSEEDRRKTITAVFMTVLGKNPAERDFSYYRFSTLTEEGLTKSLLNLPEHKKLVEKANEHTSLKQSVSDLDLQVKQLTEAMNSMKQELITMQQLLIEKNRYIQQMRGIPESNMQPRVQVQAPVQLQTQQVISSENASKPVTPPPSPEVKKLPGPFDELKNMVRGLFGGK